MDEDHVNRRDAALGLGLLGGLTILLIATIFFRIINPTPPHKVSLDGMTIASDPIDSAAPVAIQPPNLPAASPLQLDGAVGAAAYGTEAPGSSTESPATPTFISPSGR